MTIVTRPLEDFKEKDKVALEVAINNLKSSGVNFIFRSKIHQKFAIVDKRIIWYGSINLLSFGSAEESIMRIESVNVASELMEIVDV